MSPAFKFAFKKSIPIMTGFIFLGIAYGIYMHQAGFNFIYPTCMAFFIFGGSVEFIIADLLAKSFNPFNVFLITLIVNSRHLFYGISMLEKYQAHGLKKFYSIFGLIVALLVLAVIGKDLFMPISMLLVVVIFAIYDAIKKGRKENELN